MTSTLISATRTLTGEIENRAKGLGNQPYYATVELNEAELAALEDLYRILYLRVRGVPGRIFVGFDALASPREKGR